MYRRLTIGLVFALATAAAGRPEAGADLNEGREYPLFVLERSLNGNRVIYVARVTPEGLDRSRPVRAYWKLESGETEPLSSLEEAFAYGVSLKRADRDSLVFSIKALGDQLITVRRFERGDTVVVEATLPLDAGESRLDSVFVQTEGGGLMPKVKYVEIRARALASEAPVRQRITP